MNPDKQELRFLAYRREVVSRMPESAYKRAALAAITAREQRIEVLK